MALVAACAVLWDVGVVLQKRAADGLPPLTLGPGLGAALRAFLRSPRWLAGAAASALGYVLFATALTFTPVSVARAVQGLGFVVLALFSRLWLHHRLRWPEWAGVGGVTLGAVLLGLSEPPEAAAPLVSLQAVVLAAAGVAGVSVALAAVEGGVARALRAPGVAVSAGAGGLLGLGDVMTRALAVSAGRASWAALGVLGAALVAAYVSGFFMLSRGYQQGRALVVTGVSDLAARVVALAVGLGALGEALPVEPTLRAQRLVGFGLLLVATAALARFSGEALVGEAAKDARP